MKNKKAQGEIITTVLIILLVLAAIVIVWQVVQSTVNKGAKQVESQSGCLGVGVEVTKTSNTEFIAKRTAQGEIFTASSIVVISDGERMIAGDDTYSIDPSTTPLANPLDTVTIKFVDAPASSVEVGVIGDGTTCPSTGKWPAP